MADVPPVPSVTVDKRHFLVVDGVRIARIVRARKALVLENMFHRSGSNEPRFVEISLEAIKRALDKGK